jgi:hypothetical protein
MLPGKGILIGEFDLTDVHGKRLAARGEKPAGM